MIRNLSTGSIITISPNGIMHPCGLPNMKRWFTVIFVRRVIPVKMSWQFQGHCCFPLQRMDRFSLRRSAWICCLGLQNALVSHCFRAEHSVRAPLPWSMTMIFIIRLITIISLRQNKSDRPLNGVPLMNLIMEQTPSFL